MLTLGSSRPVGLTERLSLRRDRALAEIDRRRLHNRRFSIIANDCWGGAVYQRLGLPYASPFVGLMIMAPDYLDLLERLEPNLVAELCFARRSRYPALERKRGDGTLGRFPIGVLDGSEIEVHFLHYASEHVAAESWKRRCDRVDLERLWVKFDGSKDLSTKVERRRFDTLPFDHKIMFVRHRDHVCNGSGVVVPGWREDAVAMARTSARVFDVADWLNGGDGLPTGAPAVARRALLWP